MHKKSILFTLCAILILLGTGAFTNSAPSQIVQVEPIVVSYGRITIDSSFTGYWAYLTLYSTVTITPLGGSAPAAANTATAGYGQYSITWVDTGTFVSWAGYSPNTKPGSIPTFGLGTFQTVGDGVTGTVTGGQTLIVTGTLKSFSQPDLGFYDYQCGHSGPASCTNYVSWKTLLFTGAVTINSYVQWGWTYTSCGNGTWINADDGSSGDITGEPAACQNQQKSWVPLSTKSYLTLTFSPSGGFIKSDGTPGSYGCFLMGNKNGPSDYAMKTYCGAEPGDITEIPMLSGRVYQRYQGDTWGIWKDSFGNNLDHELSDINQKNGWKLQRMGLLFSNNPMKGGLWWIDYKMNP